MKLKFLLHALFLATGMVIWLILLAAILSAGMTVIFLLALDQVRSLQW